MAPSLTTMGIFIALVTMLWTGARAQSSCTTVLLSMAPCLNYVTGASSSPSPSCCSQLANVVQSQPQCLCTALSGGGSSLGISINQTLALELPKACNVQTPPVSECNAANGPPTSPVGSPEGTPEESANVAPASPSSSSVSAPPTSSSVSGSKATPSNATSSDGSTVEMPLMFIAVLLFMASYALISSSF
ncbi:non-specific lipid transfer protein GPI-anchored 5-like [Rhododendron vialii]|uniref:non-specific lipid transfer protein GPI-anchored 5-like n=1 Tax=Rhododendron vialii TaxID=182163 RepID=UPI00265FF059|nr:non-specific lipid transfer protein GPI-anchored 5-like [Rhododendron vialii]